MIGGNLMPVHDRFVAVPTKGRWRGVNTQIEACFEQYVGHPNIESNAQLRVTF
jgi:hypothetical protein